MRKTRRENKISGKFSICIAILFWAIEATGQNADQQLAGNYEYYSIKEDGKSIFDLKKKTCSLGSELFKAIQESHILITPDSIVSIDSRGYRKGILYQLEEGKGKMRTINEGKETETEYFFKRGRLYLMMKEGEQNVELVLIKNKE